MPSSHKGAKLTLKHKYFKVVTFSLCIMDQIDQWAKLYDVDRKTMELMHSANDSLGVFYNSQKLVHRVLTRNSQLVQEFLASLPTPSKNAQDMGISIDFMFPTPTAYHELFEGIFHPKFKFEEMDEEIATLYWDKDGTEFYAGPVESKDRNPKILLPTFVQTVGAWEKGFQHLVTEEMPRMIGRDFFVYSVAIGYACDYRKRKEDLGHNDVGVGSYVLWYVCSNGVYNPSSGVGEEDLDVFWDNKTAKKLEGKVKELNARFFKKDEKERASRFRSGGLF